MFLFSSFHTFHFLSDISYLPLETHLAIRTVVFPKLIFPCITYLYGCTCQRQREAKKTISTESSHSLNKPKPTGDTLTRNSSTAFLCNSSTKRELCWCLTHNKFTKSWYWGQKKEEEQSANQAYVHNPGDKWVFFKGQKEASDPPHTPSAPHSTPTIRTYWKCFALWKTPVHGWEGVNIYTYNQFYENIMFLLELCQHGFLFP